MLTDHRRRSLEYRINIPDWLDGPFVRLALLYRRIRYGYPFRRIPLTQGKYAIVDPDDFERLNRHKWYASRCRNSFYARRNIYVYAGKERKVVVMGMHRQVIKAPDGLLVDHINNNGLDNRKANLRLATHRQNNCNRLYAKRTGSHSKYIGVSWHKYKKKWYAQISFNGKRKHIGYFHDEIEAGKAYDKAAKQYHKDFAVLNFPCPRRP